jgi:hypothetical protein
MFELYYNERKLITNEQLNGDLLLMFEDTIVMRINFDTYLFEVMREDLLPWGLKGSIRKIDDDIDANTRYGRTMLIATANANANAIIGWLGSRALSLSRKNAKWIYNLLGFEQISDVVQKAKISIVCRAVSLLDNYWLKLDGDTNDWEHTNLRHNKLNEVIAQVSLHGKSLTLCGSLTSPELTTNGAYAKAWRRHKDGSLWLYKLGANGPDESKIEVMCSNLLDKMNVKHCHYEAGEDEGKYVCMCPLMTDDNTSIVSGMEFYSYCNINGLDMDKEILNIDSESIYKMWITDYLISNRDRHGQNWGLYYDAKTMKIICCHPLFDHNNAFSNEWMDNPDSLYQFRNSTIRDAAKYAISKVDFHFTAEITRKDFLTTKQYETFMSRAKELGIKTIDDTLTKALNSMSCK